MLGLPATFSWPDIGLCEIIRVCWKMIAHTLYKIEGSEGLWVSEGFKKINLFGSFSTRCDCLHEFWAPLNFHLFAIIVCKLTVQAGNTVFFKLHQCCVQVWVFFPHVGRNTDIQHRDVSRENDWWVVSINGLIWEQRQCLAATIQKLGLTLKYLNNIRKNSVFQ